MTKSKFTKTFLLLFIFLSMGGCIRHGVGGTEEGVVIKKPWFFGAEGVMDEPVKTGSHFKFPTTDIVNMSMLPVQKKEKFVDLISSDRKPVDLEVYIQLRVTRGKSPEVYKNYGYIDLAYKNTISKTFRSKFREFAKSYTMWELVEDIKVMQDLEKKSLSAVKNILDVKKIPLELIGVEVSKANPPDEVKAEVARTAAQTQRKETEKARKLAEEDREAAEIARASADNAYKATMKISSEEYIELMKIDAQYKLIEMMKNKKDLTLLVGVDAVAAPLK